MGAEATAFSPELRKVAAKSLRDATRFLFFDEADCVLCSSFKVVSPEQELTQLRGIFDSGRELALRGGVNVQTQRFEVHRYDPPLIYGRTAGRDPMQSEAFALCRTASGRDGKPVYGLITFALPNLTARLVPMLIEFFEMHLGSIRSSLQDAAGSGLAAPKLVTV